MSRYFNDFGAMHGESLEHGFGEKAHKYIGKVRTKSGKLRYIYKKPKLENKKIKNLEAEANKEDAKGNLMLRSSNDEKFKEFAEAYYYNAMQDRRRADKERRKLEKAYKKKHPIKSALIDKNNTPTKKPKKKKIKGGERMAYAPGMK